MVWSWMYFNLKYFLCKIKTRKLLFRMNGEIMGVESCLDLCKILTLTTNRTYHHQDLTCVSSCTSITSPTTWKNNFILKKYFKFYNLKVYFFSIYRTELERYSKIQKYFSDSLIQKYLSDSIILNVLKNIILNVFF